MVTVCQKLPQTPEFRGRHEREASAAGDMNIFAWGIPAGCLRLSFQLAEDPRSGESSLQAVGVAAEAAGQFVIPFINRLTAMCMTYFHN